MGKLLIVAVAVAVGLPLTPLACEGEPSPPAGDCPAAGPCEDGEVPIDCGVCDVQEGAWHPCTTAQEPGEFCGALESPDGVCDTCDRCAQDWAATGNFGEITCPALPFDDVVRVR